MKKLEREIAKEADERMASLTILKEKMNTEELALFNRMIEVSRTPFKPHKDYSMIDWNERKNDTIMWVYFNNEEYVCKVIEKNQTIFLRILTKHSTCVDISDYYYKSEARCQAN